MQDLIRWIRYISSPFAMSPLCVWGGSDKDLLFYRWGVTWEHVLAWSPNTFAFHTLQVWNLQTWNQPVAGKLRAHSSAYRKYCISSSSSSLNTWLPFPTHPINQHGRLVNSKITKQNKKSTLLLTSGLHLTVLLKLYFSLFVRTSSLFSMIIHHLGQTTLTALKTLHHVLQLHDGGTDFGSILKTVWKICGHTFMDPFSVEKDSGGRSHFLTPEARTPTLHFPPMSSLLCCFWYDLSLRCLSLQATWGWLLDITKGSLPEPPVQTSGSPPLRGIAYIHTLRSAL